MLDTSKRSTSPGTGQEMYVRTFSEAFGFGDIFT